MPVYVFKGRNVRTNENISGERSSDSRQALAAVLRREQISPITIKEKSAAVGGGFSLFARVKQAEIGIFTRQFSVMLDAGLPLVQCLEGIAQQQENKHFRVVLEKVRA